MKVACNLQKARGELFQSISNYPQIYNGQPQELTSKSKSFEKRRPFHTIKGGGNTLHHISASAANLNTTST